MGQSAKEPKHRWRENLEALTMAIVIALVFKAFFLEISKIPSGSMQPTLMGSPQAQVFDRILVDKLSYRFRDPERWEIVVFRHPLERSRVMVKRLVGMPGEELKIEHGDLWVRGAEDEDWRILRRPPAVQRGAWRRLDAHEPQRTSWDVESGARGWRIVNRRIDARGDGRVSFRAEQGGIRDDYTDGYPDAVAELIAAAGRQRGTAPPRGSHAVGDLRLTGEVSARGGLEALEVELTEGARVYAFTLPGPAAPADARPSIAATSAGENRGRAEADTPQRLAAASGLRFAVENLDDRLTLELDGEPVVTLDVAPSEDQSGSSVTLAIRGEGAELVDLQVQRDVYYYWPDRPGQAWAAAIPEGNYAMLGDNTQDSADSRDWESVTFDWADANGPHTARGNWRPGLDAQNPVRARLAEQDWIGFRDLWGERHWFPSEGSEQSFPGPAPLVPRELVEGRALAVFWPLQPLRGVWRLGWLH